jgi:hypothetical protein
METIFKIKASELDLDFIEAIKKLFKNEEIEILISSVPKSTKAERDKKYPQYSESLINAIDNVEKNKDLISFTMEEFVEYSRKLKG